MAYLQDYDTAKLLKEAETQLKSLGQQLAQLEVAKRQAVEDEDYDRAKMLKVRPDRQRTPEHSNRKYNVFIAGVLYAIHRQHDLLPSLVLAIFTFPPVH